MLSSSLNPGPLIEHSFTLEAAEQQREEEEIDTPTSSQSLIVNINGAENDATQVYNTGVQRSYDIKTRGTSAK